MLEKPTWRTFHAGLHRIVRMGAQLDGGKMQFHFGLSEPHGFSFEGNAKQTEHVYAQLQHHLNTHADVLQSNGWTYHLPDANRVSRAFSLTFSRVASKRPVLARLFPNFRTPERLVQALRKAGQAAFNAKSSERRRIAIPH